MLSSDLMSNSTDAGIFISLEGLDGAGKSTQVASLAGALQVTGRKVTIVRPAETELGEMTRAFLLQHSREPLDSWAEALLFIASRVQLINERIAPALAAGGIVVADRFVDSTYAYQGSGRHLDVTLLRRLHQEACHGLLPDLTVLLDLELPAAESRRRAQGLPEDRIEGAPGEFHQQVRESFLRMARDEPARFFVVDAVRPAVEISHTILGRVKELWPALFDGASVSV